MRKSPQGGLRGPKARYARRKQHQQGGPVDYSQTAGLYNRFLAQGDSPDMMRTQDILKWRALQDAESSSPEMYDAQSEVGRQFGKDALLTQALLSSAGMEGASAKDKYDLVKALSPAGKQVYYSQYFDDKRAGGPIDYYQTGGQALPRKQKEIRSPDSVTNGHIGQFKLSPDVVTNGHVGQFKLSPDIFPALPQFQKPGQPQQPQQEARRSIDPGFSVSPRYGQNPITGEPMRPVEMPTLPSMNIDPGFYAEPQQIDMDSLLKQIMMRGVNQSTGDSSASTVLDSMKMQQGGMVGGTPLMQDMSQDKRVKPLQPDRYVVTGGKMTKQEMEVPKLSRAYLASFGMETPLSKRQRSVLNRRAIAPETLSPQVKGLIGRILVQRLTNEPE